MEEKEVRRPWEISDELWTEIEPLLPPGKPHPLGCHNSRVSGPGQVRCSLQQSDQADLETLDFSLSDLAALHLHERYSRLPDGLRNPDDQPRALLSITSLLLLRACCPDLDEHGALLLEDRNHLTQVLALPVQRQLHLAHDISAAGRGVPDRRQDLALLPLDSGLRAENVE